jgi:hypothetical protein
MRSSLLMIPKIYRMSMVRRHCHHFTPPVKSSIETQHQIVYNELKTIQNELIQVNKQLNEQERRLINLQSLEWKLTDSTFFIVYVNIVLTPITITLIAILR